MKKKYKYKVFHASFTELESGKRRSVKLSVLTDDLDNIRKDIANRYWAESVSLTYVTAPDREEES